MDVIMRCISCLYSICWWYMLTGPISFCIATSIGHYGVQWCLSYNPSKSKVMFFGNGTQSSMFTMYGKSLEFFNGYKYLVVSVLAGPYFTTSHLKPLINFHSSANTVLNVNHKPSEQILMKMLYTTFNTFNTGCTAPTGTKENDIFSLLKMIDLIWKQIQIDLLNQYFIQRKMITEKYTESKQMNWKMRQFHKFHVIASKSSWLFCFNC